METPVFIINYQLVAWPDILVKRLRQLGARPIIVDNNSTYEPVIEWYKTKPCEIIRLDHNYGHRVVWEADILKNHKGYYGVTDPDIDIKGIPKDCIERFIYYLEKFTWATKVGCSIAVHDYPRESPIRNEAIGWESAFWKHRVPHYPEFFHSPIDTTFAIYDTRRGTQWRDRTHFCTAARANTPYTCRHLPFYVTPSNIPEDFAHYIRTASDPLATMPRYLRPMIDAYYQRREIEWSGLSPASQAQ